MNQRAVRTSENGVQLRPASLEEAGLFYSELDVEQDKALGTMSYFNEIYGDPELSSKAKMVLLYLHDRANKKGESWYAINTIAKELCLSRSSIKRAMRELIQRGKIEKRARFRENGGNTSNLYSLII